MKRLDILAAFEREINKLDDAINKPYTDDSLYWLNQAVVKFVKERFNGNAPHYTSYEQNEKRLRDLNNLETHYKKVFTVDDINTILDEQVEYVECEEPKDLMYTLQDTVTLRGADNYSYYHTATFECTNDSLLYRMTNSLTDFHYKYKKARPLRLRTQNENGEAVVRLYTDGKYIITEYYLTYLRKPEMLTDKNPDDKDVTYDDFNDFVWYEIIKIAAQMYVENQSDPRYKTLTNEVLTQE